MKTEQPEHPVEATPTPLPTPPAAVTIDQDEARVTLAWPPIIGHRISRPAGMITGKRPAWRRSLAVAASYMNRALDHLPPGRWVHRYLQRRLAFPQIDIPLRRGAQCLDGLRIAFLSDLHAGSYMNEADLCAIFAKVAAQKPDMICLGGDLINTRDREILMYRRPLQMVSPPLGVHVVPGNHDEFWDRDLGLWQAFLRELGCNVLINRGQRIEHRGGSFWLAGVDDLVEGVPDLDLALRGSEPHEPIILLSHNPDLFFEAAAVEVDLTLSGHTHGGQIALFGKVLLSHSRFGYHAGLFEEGRSKLFVGRGAGVTLLPIRIGAQAEVPIIRLRVPASSAQ